MASSLKLASVDWLSLFQQNWTNSLHFKICNQDDEELWLLSDPNLDPFEVDDLEELSLMLYRPRQELPKDRFKAKLIDGTSLQLVGRLDDDKVKLVFQPSRKKPNIFRSSLDDEPIWFDMSNPRQDYFFYRFEYGDNSVKPGTKLLYNGEIWKFVSWASPLSSSSRTCG